MKRRCRITGWQMYEGLPAFYRKKATIKDEQGNPQKGLMTRCHTVGKVNSKTLQPLRCYTTGKCILSGQRDMSAPDSNRYFKKDDVIKDTLYGVYLLGKIAIWVMLYRSVVFDAVED
ncbi:hypothetical protein STEG23_036968 [Scotinomys teguina]